MNILVLTNVYPYEKDDNTDITKVVAYFAREWVRQGHRVFVVVNSTAFPHIYYVVGKYLKSMILQRHDRIAELPSELWTLEFEYIDENVPVINLPIRKFRPHGAFSEGAIRKQTERIIATLNQRHFIPDVITGHWLNPQLMLVAGLAQHYKVKSGFVFHSDYMRERYDAFHMQRYIDAVDHIGFRSQTALNVAKGYMKFRNPPFVCSSGIPDTYVELYTGSCRPPIRDKNFHVVCVARLVGYKNILPTIDGVAAALNGSDYKMKIVGTGPLKESLTAHIREYSLENNMVIVDRMPRKDLQQLMRQSDIFVLIGSHEVFGMVYIEAMLQGCLVVASKFGGVDGIIKNGENGFLCSAGDARELESVLKGIQRLDSDEKASISQRAIETAMNYTESLSAKRYLNHIKN